MPIKQVLFDLGGVILNLDIPRTERAFAQLVGDEGLHQRLYRDLVVEKVFEHFETNTIDEQTFLHTLQSRHPHRPSFEALREAWSAMLLDFPGERLTLLEELRQAGYGIYLLSNINSIHLDGVQARIQAQHGRDLDGYFDQAFYSHLIGRRKPYAETYRYVLEQAGIQAAETLFIDDVAENILGAQQVGLKAWHHPTNGDLRASVEQGLGL